MMVDMDGQLQLADEPDESAEAIPEGFATEDAHIEPISLDNLQQQEPSQDFGVENSTETVVRSYSPEEVAPGFAMEAAPEAEEPAAENSDFQSFDSEPAAQEEPASAEPAAQEEPAPAAPAAEESWFDQGLDQAMSPDSGPPANEVDPQLSSPNFSDVENFGNQDAEAGALQFELILSQLDHADLQKEVFDVLGDPRFFLNAKELREQVQQGILTIPGLSAARTSLIVSRLRHLKINIQWRQKLYEV